MSRILALDTSTWWGGAALVECGASGPEVVAEIGLAVLGSHAERLLPAIERLLALAGWSKGDPDAYAATRGPGSFTGIRVGLGTLHGLALATGRPCYGVTTLEALAEAHGPARSERVALVAAGRGEWYAGRFDAAGSPPLALEPPALEPPAALLGRCARTELVLIPAPGTRIDPLEPGAAASVAASPRAIAAAAARIVALRHPALEPQATPLTPLYVRPPDVRLPRRA